MIAGAVGVQGATGGSRPLVVVANATTIYLLMLNNPVNLQPRTRKLMNLNSPHNFNQLWLPRKLARLTKPQQ